MSICIKCGIEHNRKKNKGKNNSDFCSYKCWRISYNQKNKIKIAKQKKEYHNQNKDKFLKYQKEYNQQNKDKIKEYHKEYHKKNRDKLNKQKREYYQQYRKEKLILVKYGLQQKDINLMLKKQENKCGICGISFNSNFHIDHNHKTGKVRGLLCQKCNHGLGLFNDNPLILAKASRYLIDTTNITPFQALKKIEEIIKNKQGL